MVVAVLSVGAWWLDTAPSHSQGENSVLGVNVDGAIIRDGLALTKLGVAEMGDNYAVAGNFVATHHEGVPHSVSVSLLTSRGRNVTKEGHLRRTLMGNHAFVVMLPRQEGEIKVITIRP
jgi:hypothetical protein